MIPVGRHESQERSNSSLATWMSAREEVYRARAERVKSVCRKYSSSDHPVNDLEGNDSISVFVLSQSSHIVLSTCSIIVALAEDFFHSQVLHLQFQKPLIGYSISLN